MGQFKDNQEFYDAIDGLCQSLSLAGMRTESDRLEFLLHEVSWTTTSELFLELETVFAQLLSEPGVDGLRTEIQKKAKALLSALEDDRSG